MNKKTKLLIVTLSAIIITGLFHRQAMGLNLLIFEILFFTWLIISKQFKFNGRNPITCSIGLIITSLFTVLTHSTFSYIINFLTLFIFIGILIYPDAKSLINSMGLSFTTLFYSQIQFLTELSRSKFKGQAIGGYLWKSRIFIIPIIIIIFFIVMYRNSNPIFDQLVKNAGVYIHERLNTIFKNFDFLIIVTFLISLFLSNFFFLRNSNPHIIQSDLLSSEELKRRKKNNRKRFRVIDLKNEYKAAVFLLLILNSILLILNVIDIYWVWFNFEWEGQYLKQFVHEGTYLLILSIIISIILVLFFFRGNLNFYRNNSLLKYLSCIWLMQNGILAISVAIRNFWYVNYFSLAYKRIGVIIFLLLTIYGLYTVLIKVQKKKSVFYLFKSNAYALYLVLIISSIVNWDILIAKYNFNNSDKSFLHLDYLSTLSDKSLPYLDKSLPELSRIDKIQKEKFLFEQKFMTPEEYHQIIETRKIIFKEKWESKNFLSWNLPEYLAYRKLYSNNHISP